jgi:hypothetical protein
MSDEPAPSSTKRRVVAAVVILGIAAAIFALRARRPAADDAHHTTLRAMSDVYLAALHAPEGATPCETAFNGLDAMVKAADERHLPPPTDLPTRQSFLSECGALPPEDQRCLVLRYQIDHADECKARTERLRAGDASPAWLHIKPPDLGGGVDPVAPPPQPH